MKKNIVYDARNVADDVRYTGQSNLVESLLTVDNLFALSRLFETSVDSILVARINGEEKSSPEHFIVQINASLSDFAHKNL